MTIRKIVGSPLTDRQERIISRSRATHSGVSPRSSALFRRPTAGRVEAAPPIGARRWATPPDPRGIRARHSPWEDRRGGWDVRPAGVSDQGRGR